MYTCKFGTFHGRAWEDLCQQVFKKKYHADGYQQIPASPGDFGLEGFTLSTGWAFQCYCPEKNYSSEALYEKQRDKITADLNKLLTYQIELGKRLKGTSISRWNFVTPTIDAHKLLSHARAKESEVRSWGLPFIADDFSVLLQDGDTYVVEINEIRSAAGDLLVFDETTPSLVKTSYPAEAYEANINRKSEFRLSHKLSEKGYTEKLSRLKEITLKDFLEADSFFRAIHDEAPQVYVRLARLIAEYEQLVVEQSLTWSGSAEDLTSMVRSKLEGKIKSDLHECFGDTNASKVARHMTARWIALCELDYE